MPVRRRSAHAIAHSDILRALVARDQLPSVVDLLRRAAAETAA